MGKTLRKWKRRKGGVYAYRTRKHAHPALREFGYVGESNSFRRRDRDHKGKTAYQRKDGTVQAATEKPWMDLDPVQHRVIRLPWWLCWKWVLRSLETLVIWVLWPRYNDAKNRWNPRRVPLASQRAQRAAREAGGVAYRVRVRVTVWGRYAVQGLGIVLIIGGLYGYWTTTN